MAMKRPSRPFFRRNVEYVAVRPVKLTSKVTLEPGELVKLRNHQLRNLFNRKRIGPVDHPWTKWALECIGANMEDAAKAAAEKAEAEKAAAERAAVWDPAQILTLEADGSQVELAELIGLAEAELEVDFDELDQDGKQSVVGMVVGRIEEEILLGADEDDDTEQTVAEDTGLEDDEPDETGNDEDTGLEDDDTDEEPELEKVGSQWTYTNIEDSPKFTSKVKAKKWLDERDETGLED